MEGVGTSDDSITSWYTSTAGRSNPYAFKVLLEEKRRRRRSISGLSSVVAGAGKCSEDKNEDFCNGPLKPDTKYYFFIRGYTSGGFSTLGPVNFTTGKKSQTALIVGLVLSLLLVTGVCIFFAVYYFRKKSSTSTSGGYDNPYTSDEYPMKPLTDANTSASDLAELASQGREVNVPLDRFEEFVAEMNRDSRLKYSDAFTELKKQALQNELILGLTIEEASQQYNRLKNRFANVLPFDQTRVCLR